MDYNDLSLCKCNWVYPTVALKCPRCEDVQGVPLHVGLDLPETIAEMMLWALDDKNYIKPKKNLTK